jgi:DNA-binding transcriptional LysR family regulator
LNVEALFDDPWVIVSCVNSRWARRRKVDLAELFDEPWLMPPPDTWSYKIVAEAFKERGLSMPTATLETYSMELRARLSALGRFVTVVPKSVLRHGGDEQALRELPIDIPIRPWPVAVLTLKNRTLSPVVERFIGTARDVAKAMAGKPQARKS